MSLWCSKKISEALSVEIDFEFQCEGVSIDSRNIQKGDLFVAIKGDNFDGNKYADQAIENGAVAAIISDEKYASKNSIFFEEGGIYALERLAYHRRKNSSAKVIAITGSVGKTTVKELLAEIFKDYYKIHKTEGNYNNHIGLPLTLARMAEDTKIAILEMGMSGKGEISHLSRVARPDIGLITNIGTAHIEFFDSQEGIAHAKSEIFDWLKVDGVAVIPADSQFFPILEEAAENNGVTNILTFGKKVNNPVRIPGAKISAHIITERYEFLEETSLEFNLSNILAVLTIAAEIGVDVDGAIESISNFENIEGRGNKFKLKTGANIVNDSYNASPESMHYALTKLSNENNFTRKVAVLGEMLELGEQSKNFHTELQNNFDNIDLIYAVGDSFSDIKHQNFKLYPSIDELKSELFKQLTDGDIVLIKGSNGSKMWKLAKDLKEAN